MRDLVRRFFPSFYVFCFLFLLSWACSYLAYFVVSFCYSGRFVWSAAVFSPMSFLYFSLKASALLALWAVVIVEVSGRFMLRAPWLVGFALSGSLCLVVIFALFVGAADRLVFIGL